MTDITKCEGGHCKLKDHCYRYTAPMNDNWQSMFVEPPCDKEGKSCEMFLGESQELLIKQLNRILNKKN